MTKIAVFALALVAFAAGPVAAQQPPHPHGTQGTPPPAGSPPAGAPAQPGGGMHGRMSGGMMHGGMCEMMMGMMGGQANLPRMMQMRGEMMKAMGDIMMKYGKMMETPAPTR